MQDHRAGVEDTFEHIDADAVCEQCSTVNPAGTLLCKTCGNNLRDQRIRRLASDEGIEIIHGSDRPRRVLTGLLVAFGLLAILWTAINVWNGNVENWLTRGITATDSSGSLDPNQYWSGPESAVYTEMSRELADNPITADEAAQFTTGAAEEGVDGRYVILADGPGSRMVGGAIVRTRGNSIEFVAQVGRGIEVRGRATVSTDDQYEAQEVGVEWGNSTLDGYGIARLQDAGVFTCVGRISNAEDKTYSATAYKLSKEQ